MPSLVKTDRGSHGLPLAIDGMRQRQTRPDRRVAVGKVVVEPQRHVIAGRIEAAIAFGGTGVNARPGLAEAAAGH